MAKVQTKAKREEGVRVVAFLLDNEADYELPEGCEVLADGILDNDEPDRTGTDKGHKLFYASFADPNNPHLVPMRIEKQQLTAPIGGQLMVTVSDKALARIKAKAG